MESRISTLALALALVCLEAPAHAAALPKLVVPAVRTTGAGMEQVEGLSALVASEASRHALKVIAGSDLASLIGLDRERQLLGCTEGSCLAELAGALGGDLLLATDASKVGEVWLLSVAVLDVKRNQALRRTTVRAAKPDAFVDLAAGAVHEVLQDYPLVATAAPVSSGRRTLGLGLDAAGVVALAGGVAFGLLASQAHGEATSLAERASGGEAVSRAEFDASWNTAQRDMVIADVLYGVGAVALGAGLYFTFTAGDSASQLALRPGPGGAVFSFSGVLP